MTPSSPNGRRVLFFGTFDPLHEGHRHAFSKARSLGDYLVVVVARDSVILEQKKRPPRFHEQQRLAHVALDPSVDEAVLGDSDASSYALLQQIPFDVLAVGYDQTPSSDEITALLEQYNLSHATVVRLEAYKPEKFKSSLLGSS